MPDQIRNRGASVRARLLKLSKERAQPFDILLTRYVLERLLYRLGTTSYKDRFALKGAMLLTVWFTDPHRILVLSRSYEFPGDALARAIAATFARRKTEIPATPPDALTDDFASDPAKVQQWESFLQNVAVHPGPLPDVVKDLAKFLMPHAEMARSRP